MALDKMSESLIKKWAALPVEEKRAQLRRCIRTYPDGHRERVAYEIQLKNLGP